MKLTYPYEMNRTERTRFLGKLAALYRGETYEEVVKVLGPPFSQDKISAKENERPLGIRLHYYMKKLGNGMNERFDYCVSLNFGTDNRLLSIDTNVAGLTFGALTGINTAGAKMDTAEWTERR
jgi:hypothetical protein